MIILQLSQEELKELISSEVSKALSRISNANAQTEKDEWFDIDQLCQYLPDNPAKQTIYGKVPKREIPSHKIGRKLFFLKSEIDAWLLTNRRKTNSELMKEVAGKIRCIKTKK